MDSIYSVKERPIPDTPVLLFECKMPNGTFERWSSHGFDFGSDTYNSRLLAHNLFEIRAGGEDGYDGIAKLSVTLANADSRFSQLERTVGFKGARITVRFVFYDAKTGAATTDSVVLFRGVGHAAEEITEATCRVSFSNRLSLQRVLIPNVRIQRRCGWTFPSTVDERQEAVNGGDKGKYSAFFRCGYSPDVAGGTGSPNGDQPFATCNFTRTDCDQRGMFRQDSLARATRRFGGIEFVPASTLVRGYGEAGFHPANVEENTARYNDFVPMVYGTAWYQPPIVFSKNDGNLTRLEVLLGLGEIQSVVKIIVNGIEIPRGQAGLNMTSTGWFNVVSLGNRTGGFNLDFADGAGQALGDPYGSMAFLSVVVPNRVHDGRGLSKIEALVEGLKVSVFDETGTYTGEAFSNNPALVMLDLLRRTGWDLDELDLASFGTTATYCQANVPAFDLHGNAVSVSRFQCNLAIQRRRSAADVVRGIRTGSALYLTYGASGKLELRPEASVAVQHPQKPEGSNSVATLNGGWPAYEFGDGTAGRSGILRRESGEPSLRLSARSGANVPNRFSLEFQDSFNEYQHDSVSLLDADDINTTGQEVASTLPAIGVANMDQALRLVQLNLRKSVDGNLFVEFETSVKAFGLKPGDLITLTYLKEGFDRKMFRVLRVAPRVNYRTVLIAAQAHEDSWYTLTAPNTPGERRPAGDDSRTPLPLTGRTVGVDGETQFEISESYVTGADGSAPIQLKIQFNPPTSSSASAAGIPILSFAPSFASTGGTLPGGKTFYYSMSALDASGAESARSFTVRADIPTGTSTNRVTLSGLSFSPGTAGFRVYRGENPHKTLRIAEVSGVAAQFPDSGSTALPIGPPDDNYHHANVYWRLELQPEVGVQIQTATTVGNLGLSMLTNEFRGAVVRITSGKGRGQERGVVANDATTLAVNAPWETIPDSTSGFSISEGSWRFGAYTTSDTALVEVPNRPGVTVQISGRAANASDEEGVLELSPLTRWQVTGASGSQLDLDTPPAPSFGVGLGREGSIELQSVAFATLVNTRSITAGTATIHYWDELQSPSGVGLSAAMSSTDTVLDLTVAGLAETDDLVQVDGEVMSVVQSLLGGLRYQVARGVFGTAATAHPTTTPVYHLRRRTVVIPFARDFFGSPASGSFAFPIYLPNARVAAVEFFVTNTHGISPASAIALTNTVDDGLRTLTGGQMAIQLDGYLAIESNVAPKLLVDDIRAIRDVYAVVAEAPAGAPIQLRVRRNGQTYCDLTIPAGAVVSNTVDGFGRPPLLEKAELTLDILSVPPSGSGSPGRDLSVILRH